MALQTEDLLVSKTLTLREALAKLNETGQGILLLADHDGRLLRTVTDGDIRRLIIGGGDLTDTLSSLPERNSRTLSEDYDPMRALTLMNELVINHLPVIDSDGRPVDLVKRRDLDTRILLSSPHLGQYEMEYIQEAFDTNWIAPIGPNVDAFEKELAAYVGSNDAAALSSGTAAIHLALRILGIGPGDRVFCSDLTFVATANPVLYEGAEPVFIGSDQETWCMSPDALERAFESAEKEGRIPKAVLVVNIYGQSADMDRILRITKKYKVPVIEDAAESLGATYGGKASGTLGDMGIFSFNGNKIITTSGGGMLVSDNREWIGKARFLAAQARDQVKYYRHSHVGYNYRLSNVLAGIGRGQLRVLKDRVATRRAIYERYREGLGHLKAFDWMPEASYGRSTRWLTVGMLRKEVTNITPQALCEAMSSWQIEVRRAWNPMHRQPIFVNSLYFPHKEDMSFDNDVFEKGVCLPSGSNMTEQQQMRVIEIIEKILG